MRPRTLLLVTLALMLLWASLLTINLTQVSADDSIVRSENVQLHAGETISIQSDRNSLQTVFISGNLSYAQLTEPPKYPGDIFALGTTLPGQYEISAAFDYTSDYTVRVHAVLSDNSTRQLATYYLSGGQFTLNLAVTFTASTASGDAGNALVSPWSSLTGWIGRFSEAFPVWVKLLYLLFGAQFFLVGGVWIRRETLRREGTPHTFDLGNRLFLWFDVTYKFLASSFIAILAVMLGELLILFVLRFMFLASFDLLSLWDLFVVGFAAGMAIIVYVVRFFLEKGLDLKPLEEE